MRRWCVWGDEAEGGGRRQRGGGRRERVRSRRVDHGHGVGRGRQRRRRRPQRRRLQGGRKRPAAVGPSRRRDARVRGVLPRCGDPEGAVPDGTLAAYCEAVLGRVDTLHPAAGALLLRLAGGGAAKYGGRAAPGLAKREEFTPAVLRTLQAAALSDGAVGGGGGAGGDLPRGNPPRPPPPQLPPARGTCLGRWFPRRPPPPSVGPSKRGATSTRRSRDRCSPP